MARRRRRKAGAGGALSADARTCEARHGTSAAGTATPSASAGADERALRKRRKTAVAFGFLLLGVVGLVGIARQSDLFGMDSVPPLEGTARQSLVEAMEHYEAIRGALSNDEYGVAADVAERLAASARAAAASAPPPAKSQLGRITHAATRLGRARDDPAAMRFAFGRMSRAFLTLLADEEVLRQGLYTFECLGAPGYGKWIQRSETPSNPYQGTRMRRCGLASRVEP